MVLLQQVHSFYFYENGLNVFPYQEGQGEGKTSQGQSYCISLIYQIGHLHIAHFWPVVESYLTAHFYLVSDLEHMPNECHL